VAMEQDPAKINDYDRQLATSIEKLGEFAAGSNQRQRDENKLRAENRAKVKELGVGTYAYQVAVKVCKDMTEGERKDFLRDLELLVRILGPKQKDLFADELIKAEAREKKRQEKESEAGRTKAELDAKTDTDPKSDPAAGGAGKKPKGGKKKATEAVEELNRAPLASEVDPAAAQAAAEQAEGEKLLDGAGKPKSQTEIAQQKRDEAGVP
jgi:hypothetical protein